MDGWTVQFLCQALGATAPTADLSQDRAVGREGDGTRLPCGRSNLFARDDIDQHCHQVCVRVRSQPNIGSGQARIDLNDPVSAAVLGIAEDQIDADVTP